MKVGQSLGAFIPRGITLRLEGTPTTTPARGSPAGGSWVRPPRDAGFTAH
ncbi:hypothetical protein QJS66_02215 [Kocuria rhizophila]|nr:hypothetical protein QJS66_02215 [Kocuria rhizophila]